MKNLHLTLVPVGIVLMVAGCGGGGGSSSSSSGSQPTANVKITTTNSTKFASGAVSSTNQVTGSANSGNSTVGLRSLAQTATTKTLNAATIAATRFNKVINLSLPGSASGFGKAAAPISYSYDCQTGSSVASSTNNTFTLTVTKAGVNWAAGDGFTLSYNNCYDQAIDGTLLTFNGSMSYSITSLVVGSSAGYKTTFTSFSLTDGVNTLAMNGDMTNSASLSGQVLTSSISGNSFSVTVDGNGFTMNSYSETFTYNVSTTAYSYAINMSLALSGEGTVDITTSPAFSGVGAANPTAGTFTISGTNGTYVSVSASDATHATLKVNNGTDPVSTTQVLWTDL